MGTKISKDAPPSNQNKLEMSKDIEQIDYKSRLEKKLCLAKETPEPIYDISECNLKDVPSGVFIICKVLRKEELNLRCNKLTNLSGGGLIQDLQLLRILNLSINRIKKIPDDINKLQNLRELFISDNQLESLPTSINRLKQLEILDISNNKLASIQQISFMMNLKVLNVTGNPKLSTLPNELSTCDNLTDIVFDITTISYPELCVLQSGTRNILQFLSTGEILEEKCISAIDITENLIKIERHETDSYRSNYDNEKYLKEQKFLALERKALENDYQLESQLHAEQQKKKEILLQKLLMQQQETESRVSELQENRTKEQKRLIDDLLRAEENNNLIVSKLLTLKMGPDASFLEQERMDQERLLQMVREQQENLRKQEILNAMADFLKQETDKIQNFNDARNVSSKNTLDQEFENTYLLNEAFHNYDKNRSEIIEKVNYDENLQKSAVAKLISNNDARTWGLVQQVRIVESQLANMTNLELERKKLCIDEHMMDLSVQRLALTNILIDLLDQQDQRKQQLLFTLQMMEEEQKEHDKDFWLLQYQHLMDAQPIDVLNQTVTIDPQLGCQFLINNVVHLMPFLAKILKEKELTEITDSDLINIGIKNKTNRINILLSIENYMTEKNDLKSLVPRNSVQPECSSSTSAPVAEEVESSTNAATISAAECVICMDAEVKVIFLPCGHMCCCSNCQNGLTECPMCRGQIDRKINVIQP